MKFLKILIMVLILMIILTALILIKSPNISLPWQSRHSTQVYTELVESTESSLLQTAEFRLKLIFPYDFIDEGDLVDWSFLQRQYNYLPEEFQMRSSRDFYADRKIPEQWKYAELYSLCRESGIDPAGRDEDFIVISSRTRAGFSFNEDSISFKNESPGDKDEQNMVLTLPAPEITAIIIDDRPQEDEGYPELKMSPSQWSQFIEALTPEIGELALDEGILDLAEESARFLLGDLFLGAGIEIQRIDFYNETAE